MEACLPNYFNLSSFIPAPKLPPLVIKEKYPFSGGEIFFCVDRGLVRKTGAVP